METALPLSLFRSFSCTLNPVRWEGGLFPCKRHSTLVFSLSQRPLWLPKTNEQIAVLFAARNEILEPFGCIVYFNFPLNSPIPTTFACKTIKHFGTIPSGTNVHLLCQPWAAPSRSSSPLTLEKSALRCSAALSSALNPASPPACICGWRGGFKGSWEQEVLWLQGVQLTSFPTVLWNRLHKAGTNRSAPAGGCEGSAPPLPSQPGCPAGPKRAPLRQFQLA